MSKLTIPSAFSLAQYRLKIRALETLHFNLSQGSTLRGGFGHTFKRLACRQPWPCDKYCQLGNHCAYGYIFETAPPEGAEVLRNLDDIPRPFIIQVSNDRRATLAPNEIYSFGLILIGRGMSYRQDFERVFQRMGQEGFGKTQGKYQLLEMNLISEKRADEIAAQAAALPAGRLTLDFLTPARLKHEGKWVDDGPPFQALIKVLLGRVSSLSYFHCGERWAVDFRGLIDQAGRVQIVQSDAGWQDWSRFSGRQKQRIELGGLVGRVTYTGDLRPYLPLLALGELIHVGKGTVFGNGQYSLKV